MKILRTPLIDRCIGCHACSLACARLVHGRLSWTCAGIHIRSAGGLSTGFEARLCQACTPDEQGNPAPCVAACPTGACSARKGGGVKMNPARCIHCGKCASACPLHAIYMDEEKNIFVCLHCGRCVPFCPHSCLALEDTEDNGLNAAPLITLHSLLPAASADTPQEKK